MGFAPSWPGALTPAFRTNGGVVSTLGVSVSRYQLESGVIQRDVVRTLHHGSGGRTCRQQRQEEGKDITDRPQLTASGLLVTDCP